MWVALLVVIITAILTQNPLAAFVVVPYAIVIAIYNRRKTNKDKHHEIVEKSKKPTEPHNGDQTQSFEVQQLSEEEWKKHFDALPTETLIDILDAGTPREGGYVSGLPKQNLIREILRARGFSDAKITQLTNERREEFASKERPPEYWRDKYGKAVEIPLKTVRLLRLGALLIGMVMSVFNTISISDLLDQQETVSLGWWLALLALTAIGMWGGDQGRQFSLQWRQSDFSRVSHTFRFYREENGFGLFIPRPNIRSYDSDQLSRRNKYCSLSITHNHDYRLHVTLDNR